MWMEARWRMLVGRGDALRMYDVFNYVRGGMVRFMCTIPDVNGDKTSCWKREPNTKVWARDSGPPLHQASLRAPKFTCPNLAHTAHTKTSK